MIFLIDESIDINGRTEASDDDVRAVCADIFLCDIDQVAVALKVTVTDTLNLPVTTKYSLPFWYCQSQGTPTLPSLPSLPESTRSTQQSSFFTKFVSNCWWMIVFFLWLIFDWAVSLSEFQKHVSKPMINILLITLWDCLLLLNELSSCAGSVLSLISALYQSQSVRSRFLPSRCSIFFGIFH